MSEENEEKVREPKPGGWARIKRVTELVFLWVLLCILVIPMALVTGLCKGIGHVGEFIEDYFQGWQQNLNMALRSNLWDQCVDAFRQNKQLKSVNRMLREDIDRLKADLALSDEGIEDTLSERQRKLWAHLQRDQPGLEIERDPYSIGYWARDAGFGEPTGDSNEIAGWQERDKELKQTE